MLDAAGWKRISDLFDELREQSAEQRQQRLRAATLPAHETEWLRRWLEAADSPDTLLLDATMDDLAMRLMRDSVSPALRIPRVARGQRFGHWRALEVIGRGGMGMVMRGERADGRFEKAVAIKLLPPGPASQVQHQHLQAEIRTLARLEHPGIARLLDGGITEEGQAYLVMEYVPGRSVDQYANAHGLDAAARVRLVRQVAAAVAYSHQQLVVHCDIKPSNVLVADDGQVRLVDFGVASLLNEHPDHQALRPELRCSPAYASPEQLAGAPPSVAQDVFGLGALLYLLLTGRPVRDAREATGLLLGATTPGAVTPDADPPRAFAGRLAGGRRMDLDAICGRALAHDADRRYGDVGVLIADLDNWLRGHPVHARRGGRLYRAGCWARRHRAAAAAGLLALVSLIAGAGIAGWQATEARSEAARAESETRRATSALADTRAALERAEALHEFLLDLFRATHPDRPRDQLPDTEAILALGAERALDPESAEPAVRLGMLLTIARVYSQHDRHEQAAQLFETARQLAVETDSIGDLAAALYGLGLTAQRERRLRDADDYLRGAVAKAAGRAETWEIWAQANTFLGANEMLLGNLDAARDILEPLVQDMQQRENMDPALLASAMGELASVYRVRGDLSESLRIRLEVADLYKRVAGPEGLDYALSLANLSNLYHNLGRFDQAERSARDSLALLDRIFERPAMFRAVTRSNLALMLLYQGRFDEAEAELLAASQERALALDRPLESLEVHFYQRGGQLLAMRRWVEAERELERARELYAQRPDAGAEPAVMVDAGLAIALCEQDRTDQASTVLEEMQRRLDGALPENPTQRAQVHHARATCALHRRDLELALAETDLALAAQDYAGRAPDRAERLLLRARILAAMGRAEQAQAALADAEHLLQDVGLPRHPMLERIAASRHVLTGHDAP